MSRSFTRLLLRDAAKLLADDEDNGIATDAQYLLWLDEAVAKYWDMLIDSGIVPDLSNHDIPTTSGSEYTLAADHGRILVVHKLDANNRPEYKLKRLNMHDWSKYDVEDGQDATRYFPHPDTGIRLLPEPASGQTYRVWYVPDPPLLDDDVKTVDLQIAAKRYITTDVAIQAKIKEESSTTDLRKERAECQAEIVKRASSRVHEAMLVPDAPHSYPSDPSDYRPGRRRW